MNVSATSLDITQLFTPKENIFPLNLDIVPISTAKKNLTGKRVRHIIYFEFFLFFVFSCCKPSYKDKS